MAYPAITLRKNDPLCVTQFLALGTYRVARKKTHGKGRGEGGPGHIASLSHRMVNIFNPNQNIFYKVTFVQFKLSFQRWFQKSWTWVRKVQQRMKV